MTDANNDIVEVVMVFMKETDNLQMLLVSCGEIILVRFTLLGDLFRLFCN